MLGVEDEFCIFIVGIPKRKRRNNEGFGTLFRLTALSEAPLFTVVLIETLFEF